MMTGMEYSRDMTGQFTVTFHVGDAELSDFITQFITNWPRRDKVKLFTSLPSPSVILESPGVIEHTIRYLHDALTDECRDKLILYWNIKWYCGDVPFSSLAAPPDALTEIPDIRAMPRHLPFNVTIFAILTATVMPAPEHADSSGAIGIPSDFFNNQLSRASRSAWLGSWEEAYSGGNDDSSQDGFHYVDSMSVNAQGAPYPLDDLIDQIDDLTEQEETNRD